MPILPKQPSAANVPTVVPVRDPGVAVEASAFQTDLGIAAEELTPAADTFAEISLRNDGLARDAADTSYAEELSNLRIDLEKNGDISDEAQVQEVSNKARQVQEQILANYKGTNQGRFALENRLNNRHLAFTDSLAVGNIAAAESKQAMAATGKINAATKRVIENPDILLGGDLGSIFENEVSLIEDDFDLLNLRGAKRESHLVMAKANIAQGMITPLIQNGNFEAARQLLRDDRLAEAVPSAQRREMAARVNQAERELNTARQRGENAIATARAIAGPDASDDEVSNLAAQLEGADPSMNFVASGGKVGIFKNGELVGIETIETPEEIIEREAAVATAKANARIEMVGKILREGGAEPIPPSTVEGEEHKETRAITRPFGADVVPSKDAEDAARLVVGARRLFMAGMIPEANFMLRDANQIISNSPEIQFNREMEKPLGAEMLAETGMPPGSTMRDLQRALKEGTQGVRGVRSPEEKAEATAEAQAHGKERVGAKGQLRFIDQATLTIDDLIEELESDPKLVGVLGGARAVGQTAIEVLSDLGLGQLVDNVMSLAVDESELGIDAIEQYFENDTLSTINVLENTMGFILARTRQPEGRLNVDTIKRSIKDVKLTGFTGSKQVIARLNFIKKHLNRSSDALRKEFDLSKPNEVTETIPRFRVVNGVLVPEGAQ